MTQTVQLKINLDGTQAQRVLDGLERDSAFNKLRDDVRRFGRELDVVFRAPPTLNTRASVAQLNQMTRAAEAAERAVNARNTASGVGSVLPALGGSAAGLLGPLAGGASVAALVRLADEAANLEARLKLVTASTAELTRAQSGLFSIAQSTSSSFAGTVDLYARFAGATRELNLGQERLLAITTTVNQAVQLSGASSESSRATLIQFGQGLAAGALRGEELNSVLEQTPRLAQALAAGFGVSIGQLRALAAENRLTSAAIVDALESQRETLEREFATLPQTVGRSLTQLGNTALQAAGQINESAGLTRLLSGAITDLSATLQGGTLRDGLGGVASAVGVLARNLDILLAFFVGRAALPVVVAASAAAVTTLSGSIALLGPALGTAAAGALGLQAALAPLLGVVSLTTFGLAALGAGVVAVRESESSLEQVTEGLTAAKKRLAEASAQNTDAALDEALAKRELALAELEQLKNAARQSPFIAGVGQGRERRQLEADLDALDLLITERQRQLAGEFQPATGPIRAEDVPVNQTELNRLVAQRVALESRIAGLTNEQQVQQSILTGELRNRSALEQQEAINIARLQDQIAGTVTAQRSNTAAVRETNAALNEQIQRRQALDSLDAQRDSQGLSRAVQLAQSTLTPVEQFRQRLAEINALVRNGDLERAAQRTGVNASELQNRLVQQAGEALPRQGEDPTEETARRLDTLTTLAEQAARNVQDVFADFLFNPLNGGLRGFASNFARTLAQIAAQAAASGILRSVFGGLAGSSSPFLASLGSAFGGGRALGGPVSPGRLYEVNERVPELLSTGGRDYLLAGSRGGDITPLRASGGDGPRYTINVDARNASNPAEMQAAVQQGVRMALATVSRNAQRGLRADD